MDDVLKVVNFFHFPVFRKCRQIFVVYDKIRVLDLSFKIACRCSIIKWHL